MSQCQFGDCRNEATKTVSRIFSEEEQAAGTADNWRGSRIPISASLNVCDDHLKEAQKEYPVIEGEL
jgi:hypothetical protein